MLLFHLLCRLFYLGQKPLYQICFFELCNYLTLSHHKPLAFSKGDGNISMLSFTDGIDNTTHNRNIQRGFNMFCTPLHLVYCFYQVCFKPAAGWT